MIKKLAQGKSKSLMILIILVTLSLACLCLPAGVTPTLAPTTIPSTVETKTPVPVKPPVVIPPTTRETLNDEGPWLLIHNREGLWAANPDGSGLILVTEDHWPWEWDFKNSIQPGGNQMVFISPMNDWHNRTLNLITLPDGTITKITDLTSPETERYADLMPGEYGFEAMMAIGEHNYAWSPDGTQLAFVGLMDGPSAEIYIFDTLSGEITRVSNDDAQNYWPSWSHDGANLVYLGAEAFGTGAGFDTTGVWLANGDGTGASPLYTPAGGSEEVVGWLADNQTILVQTWHPASGSEGLRLFDIVTKESSSLTDDYITSAAVDIWGNSAVFATYDDVYLLTDAERTPALVSTEDVAQVKLTEPGDRLFSVTFSDGRLETFGTGDFDHQVSPVASPTWGIDVAEYALFWGWTNRDDDHPGAWITGPGVEIGQIYTGAARLPTWDAHNNLLFFADADGGGYDLYRTTFDLGYSDMEIVGHLDIEPLWSAWMKGNER